MNPNLLYNPPSPVNPSSDGRTNVGALQGKPAHHPHQQLQVPYGASRPAQGQIMGLQYNNLPTNNRLAGVSRYTLGPSPSLGLGNTATLQRFAFNNGTLSSANNGGRRIQNIPNKTFNVFENKKLNNQIELKRNKRAKMDNDSDDGANNNNDDEGSESESGDETESDDGGGDKVVMRETDMEKLMSMVNYGTKSQLSAIPTCSAKRAELLMELRPFKDYNDLVMKLERTKGLSLSIVENYYEMLDDYRKINLLLDKCGAISTSVSKRIKEESRTEIDFESFLSFPLKEYQIIGFNWLRILYESHLGGILADEMGLGKTIQAISLVAYARLVKKDKGPFLIVVPTSTVDNWLREFTKWCPALVICEFFGSISQRDTIRNRYKKNLANNIPTKWDVVLTTYAIINSKNDDNFIRKLPFSIAIFDEGHMLKNMSSQRYTKLTAYKTGTRFLLTGTPLQNNLLELMSLTMFILPTVFKSPDDKDLVKRLFTGNKITSAASEQQANTTQPTDVSNSNPLPINESSSGTLVPNVLPQETELEASQDDYLIFTKSQEIMHPFVLRRLKKDVLGDIPDKLIHVKKIIMAETQAEMYTDMIADFKSDRVDENESRLKNITMHLRKMANHPLHHLYQYTETQLKDISKQILMEPDYYDKNSEYIYEDLTHMSDYEIHTLCKRYNSINKYKLSNELIMDCGKFNYLKTLLPQLYEKGDRLLIFSQFVITLNILEEFLNILGYKYVRLDGSTNSEERQMIIDTFNNTHNMQSDNDIPFIFLLSTRAGGVGINLTSANVIILYDIDFNPHNDKQAEDRAHRVGQTKEVNVYKLISENSIEEHILSLANKKLALEKDVSECAKDLKEDMYKVLKTAVMN